MLQSLLVQRPRYALLLLTGLACACSESPEPSATAPEPQASAQPAGAAAVAFTGARIITGDGSAPIEDGLLVVADGRYLAVGSAGEVNVPAGAQRIDLAGATIMPAIIDTHAHLNRERAPLIEDLRRRAYFGIGAVMSLGQDVGEAPFALRAETPPNAARYFTAGRGITGPEPGRSDIPYWVTTPEEARSAVREQAALDVDIIKIWVDDRDGTVEKLAPEVYRAVIDEAHQHDLRVTAHIFDREDAKDLLRAGIDAFAHGVRDQDIDEEFIALFRERPNVVLAPNLPNPGVPVDLEWLAGTLPAARLDELRAANGERPDAQAAFGIQARNLDRLNAAGVQIALGTDGNTPWAAHFEMEDMVRAGMTPQEVIVAATRNSAELLGLTEAGTIEAGHSADFVVLDADPLEDIRNTRQIRDVYLGGVRVDREALRASFASL